MGQPRARSVGNRTVLSAWALRPGELRVFFDEGFDRLEKVVGGAGDQRRHVDALEKAENGRREPDAYAGGRAGAGEERRDE